MLKTAILEDNTYEVIMKADTPNPINIKKSPTLENKNSCFEILKQTFDTTQSNGDWYNFDDPFKNVYIKCINALKEENIIELEGSSAFKFKEIGYEIYAADSYIDYTIKKNILYFLVDAMKSQNGISFDTLLNKIKSSSSFNPTNIVANSAVIKATQELFEAISSNIEIT